MTDRLYYSDPYLREFDATIVRVDRRDDRLFVALDRTAFYPTSGGQPFDTGRLASLRVVDVVDEALAADGEVGSFPRPAHESCATRTVRIERSPPWSAPMERARPRRFTFWPHCCGPTLARLP